MTMSHSTYIREMMGRHQIRVPNYQRAYSWDVYQKSDDSQWQVKTFLDDLYAYVASNTQMPYYFGHFLFEQENKGDDYNIIDGQQRMTTIVIFLAAIFARLQELKKVKTIADLGKDLSQYYEDMIKSSSTYRFSTVYYDDNVFKDYVIDHKTIQLIKQQIKPNQSYQMLPDTKGFETESQKRIIFAYHYFKEELNKKSEESELLELLYAVTKATCTTHTVSEPADAVQMFIFQNNRGKKTDRLGTHQGGVYVSDTPPRWKQNERTPRRSHATICEHL